MAEPLLNVNTAAASEFMPTVSGDGLELYFVRNNGGTDPGHLFVSTRASHAMPWLTPVEVAIGVGHLHPELSADALELYTVYSSAIYRATRGSRIAPWSAPQRLFDGSSPATGGAGTSLLYVSFADGLVKVRHRASLTASWGAEEAITTTTGGYNAIGVNAAETYMIFTLAFDPFSFPNAASMARSTGEAGWRDFLELPTLQPPKALACDFVSDAEVYCGIDVANRRDIARFARM